MTYTQKIFRKVTLIPILLAFGFMFATPMLMDAAAAPGGNGNGNGGNSPPSEAILPDITPGIPKHLAIHNQQQMEWLRFTNTWNNVGAGPLEFEPIFPDPNANEGTTQDAYQNLYDDAGNFGMPTEKIWTDVVSQFEFHDIHNHWHIGQIGEFSVRADENGSPGAIAQDVNGEDLASVKVGFCIADVYKYNGDNSPTSQRLYWDCEVGLQGIQPGWADQYHQSVEGNEINITDLPNGTYFLVHKWNPANAFVDADVSNDESWMKFELSDDGNGNRKIVELQGFAPECQDDGSTPGICGEINKNN